MGAENIIRCDATAAEAAVDGLHLYSLATKFLRRQSITNLSGHQLLEMFREHVAQLARRAKAIFRFVLDRAHENALHLSRNRGRNLARTWILVEVKDQ